MRHGKLKRKYKEKQKDTPRSSKRYKTEGDEVKK